MSSGAGADGDVDWLTTPSRPDPPRRPPRRLVVGVVLVAATAAVLGPALVARYDSDREPESAPTPSALRLPTRAPTTSSPTPPTGPVVVRRSGPLVQGLEVDWELFARTDDTVYRIDVRTGRVTATRHESLGTSGPVTFVADGHGVVLRPMDEGTGVAVPDGRPARPLQGLLASGGYTLPGPPGTVWVDSRPSTMGGTTAMRLVRFDGTATRESVAVDSGYFSSDGAGGLLISDVGGVWEARPDGLRRVTPGGVMATGRRHYLVVDCDERHSCHSSLYDRKNRTQRRLAIPYPGGWYDGALSPDGRYVAFTRFEGDDQRATLEVFDLRTSRTLVRTTGPDPGVSQTDRLWSPDGRWLAGVVDGRLALIDLRTGRRTTPSLPLSSLVQLTGRG
jgi:hypothetical protein